MLATKNKQIKPDLFYQPTHVSELKRNQAVIPRNDQQHFAALLLFFFFPNQSFSNQRIHSYVLCDSLLNNTEDTAAGTMPGTKVHQWHVFPFMERCMECWVVSLPSEAVFLGAHASSDTNQLCDLCKVVSSLSLHFLIYNTNNVQVLELLGQMNMYSLLRVG